MNANHSYQLNAVLEVDVGSPISQCRAAPVCLGPGAPSAILAVYAADFDVDPYHEMFFFPSDTLKIIVFDDQGEILWRRDLGKGVVPGMWFCPVFPFDLDGDGVDEIYFVNNVDPAHPLGVSNYRLARLDARTGQLMGQWPWEAKTRGQVISHAFRNFILGGHVKGEPVLVTAQGTYQSMHLQAWHPDMVPRWTYDIPDVKPGTSSGARGSHMCPVTDLDGDGIEEVLWGERCIELDTGEELFCADHDAYQGHSDIIQPFYDPSAERWFIYTLRESDPETSPRVVCFDDQGDRMWGAVEQGHMDMGWVARMGDGGRKIGAAIRIGHKVCGPDGRLHTGTTEFAFDALTGERLALGFSTYQTMPVDLSGDGYHELVRGRPSGNGEVLDRSGRLIADIGAPVAMACKFLDMPGEQMLAYYKDGVLRVWADANAEDSEAARARYRHAFYRANRRLSATGWNLTNLGGI